MVFSEILSLNNDENDLYGDSGPFREHQRAVEHRHGWFIPPEWECISEVWEYKRKTVSETVYDHDSEVNLLDGESPIIRE